MEGKVAKKRPPHSSEINVAAVVTLYWITWIINGILIYFLFAFSCHIACFLHDVYQFSSVQSLSCVQLFSTPWPPCPSPSLPNIQTPGITCEPFQQSLWWWVRSLQISCVPNHHCYLSRVGWMNPLKIIWSKELKAQTIIIADSMVSPFTGDAGGPWWRTEFRGVIS